MSEGFNKIFEQGRIPPNATDLEEAVLGAIMLEKDSLTVIVDILSPEVFYKEQHKIIYAAIHRLFSKAEPVDILTVTHELINTGELEIIGGAYYITQLTNRIASTANIEFHSRIILQKYIQRELIRVSSMIIRDAFEETTNVQELYSKAISELINLINTKTGSTKNITTIVSDNVKEIEAIIDNPQTIIGVDTGYYKLNKVILGFQSPDFVVIAARPGMGKTACMMSLCNNIAINQKVPCGIFSLEMSAEQLGYRLLTMRTGFSYSKLRSGDLTKSDLRTVKERKKEINNSPLYIDDSSAINSTGLRAKSQRMVSEWGVKVIFIDYLQLMSGDNVKGQNREQEVSKISRDCKAIAKDLNIPVIAFAQLSREVEKRTNRRPQLSDLRSSGAIEQDADIVMFLFRPYIYEMMNKLGEPYSESYAEWIIEKHRNGSLATLILEWHPQVMTFKEEERAVIEEQKVISYESPDTSELNEVPF